MKNNIDLNKNGKIDGLTEEKQSKNFAIILFLTKPYLLLLIAIVGFYFAIWNVWSWGSPNNLNFLTSLLIILSCGGLLPYLVFRKINYPVSRAGFEVGLSILISHYLVNLINSKFIAVFAHCRVKFMIFLTLTLIFEWLLSTWPSKFHPIVHSFFNRIKRIHIAGVAILIFIYVLIDWNFSSWSDLYFPSVLWILLFIISLIFIVNILMKFFEKYIYPLVSKFN